VEVKVIAAEEVGWDVGNKERRTAMNSPEERNQEAPVWGPK